MTIAKLVVSFFALTAFAAPAYAQMDNSQTNGRVDHLEHDLQMLQRQISRSGTPSGGDSDVPVGGSAQLEVRFSTLEEQMRDLRGKVEESDNRSRKLVESVEKLQRDVDFRFNELAANPSARTPAAPAPAPAATAETGAVKSLGTTTTPAPKAAEAPAPKAATGKEDLSSFSTPRELYNYAFRLLNQTQYEEAATAFDAFTKKYPKDPLVGNSYYWKGETYYIRRDYVNSADNFRQGFEALPEGPKAADNLLKLAMSLSALSREKEACIVLGQVVTKFKKSSSNVADKAEQEQKRIACAK